MLIHQFGSIEKHRFNPSVAYTWGLTGFAFTIKCNVLYFWPWIRPDLELQFSWHVSLSDTSLPIARAKCTHVIVDEEIYKQISRV